MRFKQLKCTLFYLVLLIGANVKAQVYFNRQYPYNSLLVANASSVIELDAGGYLFKGCNFGAYNSLLVLRIDVNGDTLFTKEFYMPATSFSNGTSNSFIKTLDGNYAFTVSSYKNNNRDGLLVKLKENGDTLWTKTFGGNNFDVTNIVCQTADSSFVLMGVTQSFSNGSASDFYLIKTDKYGNQQWQQTYGTTLAEDCVSGQITLDGGYVMAGIKNSLLYALKTDANGVFKWDKQLPNTAGTGFIKQLPDSTYLLVGAKIISGMGGQACMTKLNKLGGIMWQKSYGGVGDQQFYTVPILLNDGSIVCAGTSRVSNAYGLLIKTDSAGNEQWTRTYYANPNNDNYVYDVKHTSDGGFILSGYMQYPWLVKVDSLGCEVAGCSVGIEQLIMDNEELIIYPNPVSTSLTLALSKGERIGAVLIYNVLGEEVLSQKFVSQNSKEVSVDVSGLVSGVYVVEIKTDASTSSAAAKGSTVGLVLYRKLVKE